MDLDFSWELKIFSFFESRWKKRKDKKNKGPAKHVVVEFKEVETKMLFLARSLSKQPVVLQQGADEGGMHGAQFIVPEKMALSDDRESNRKAWIFRIWFMSRLFEENVYLDANETELSAFVKTCLAIRQILTSLKQTSENSFSELVRLVEIEDEQRLKGQQDQPSPYHKFYRWCAFLKEPEMERIFAADNPPSFRRSLLLLEGSSQTKSKDRFPKPSVLFGRLMTPGRALDSEGLMDDELADNKSQFENATEMEAPAMDDVESVTVSKKDQEDSVLMHTFEKVECLDDYNGLPRDFDGSDELEDHKEAMEELKMRQVIRTNETTHSIYRADIRLKTEIGDLEGPDPKQGIPYPEWDAKKRKYRLNWCWVKPKVPDLEIDKIYSERIALKEKKSIKRLQKKLEAIRFSPAMTPRSLDGEWIDMDQAVDNQCLIKAGQTPSERVYVRREKKKRELATLILIDLSLSADGYINGKRVLDTAKESLIILGKSLQRFEDLVEVAGFYSSTRKDCGYVQLKGFHETWEALYHRLGNLQAQGYTRIGPALRHATHRVSLQQSRVKNVVLLSDGKPNDYDRYEGFYGIKDTRQAVREAAAKDVHVFGLAISDHAYDYLPAMLGRKQYAVLKNPSDLVDAMGDLYLKFMR